MDRRDRVRSQSEVIGTLLFTAVIILLAALVGLFVLSGADSGPEPAVEMDLVVDSSTARLVHGGGHALPESDVEVAFGGDADASHGLGSFTEVQGDGDGQFEAGEIREHSHGATDTLSVIVVHEPTDTILFRDTVDVP